jgi:leucyl/phenylalanyl-tRNA--protein transferase
MPVEPPTSKWTFPPATTADAQGIVGIGADLEPGTLLAAYRCGLFPMPLRAGGPLAWWSPDPRGIIPLDGVKVSRSLRRSARRYEIRVDTAFADVVEACSDPARDGGWIDGPIQAAYRTLHELGWAHSVEAWDEDGALAGGLYGVAIGGLFAGESMFHRSTDASKVALIGLVDLLGSDGGERRLLDVQWTTDHLRSLGAVDLGRASYLGLLEAALALPLPTALDT